MIKAIQTVYKGYKFRSRLEARWAVFFDALGLDWDYEPEGFEFEDGTRYLPDFFIKMGDSLGWFVEVKGDFHDRVGIEKAQQLDNYPPGNVMGCLIVGSLEHAEITPASYTKAPDYNHTAIFVQCITPIGQTPSLQEIKRAINKARSARFEHGEEGAVI